MTQQPRPESLSPVVTRRRRMSKGQRRFLWFLAFLVILAVLAVGALLFADFQMGNAGQLNSLGPGQGTYLVVGSDSRENLPDDLEGQFGDFAGARADVIMLMQVSGDRLQLLSIPRDLRVEIPGNGVNKVNAAYALGGPDLLVETVSTETGLSINHYMEVDFGGFAEIVDAVGGIEIDFPAPARDLKSGLSVTEAGPQTVGGATALAYARSRSYEEMRDGAWQPGDGGDIARTARQRQVLLEIMAKASSPSGMLRSPVVVNQVTSNLTVDETVSPVVLLGTAWDVRSAGTTEAVSLPVTGTTENGISYVVRVEPAATDTINAFATGSPLPEG